MLDNIPIEHRFHFDLSGFLVLRNVLTPEECETTLNVLSDLENRTYKDEWMASAPTFGRPKPLPTCDKSRELQIRLNGLLRLDSVFDLMIAHPKVVPYLKAFMGEPQLINTWSISKFKGAQQGGWHRGVPTTDYSYRNGDIRSRMLNTVYFLTDNGPDDGCVVAVPGSHKSNFDLSWQAYQGLDLPGAVAVTGKAGDVLLFSETVIHNGLPKTTEPVRSNLYFNYTHAHYNVMMREPPNGYHRCLPPEIRERFNEAQKEMTRWMELARWDM